MSDAIAQSLKMPHLADIARQTQEAVDAARRPADAVQHEPQPTADARCKNRYTFDIDHTQPNGTRYTGRFTNKILTLGEKITVGITRARLQMGVPLDAITTDTYNLLFMTTSLQQSLVERPKWAEDLLSLESEDLVRAIFDQCDAHERIFRGERPSAAPGADSV